MLTDHGYLVKQPVNARKGAYTASFHMLGWKALLELQGEKAGPRQLARPSPTVLDYLLLRNELYAEARRAGWYVASPVLVTPGSEAEARYLKLFRAWVEMELRRKLLQAQRDSPADALRFQAEIDNLGRLLPTSLSWEFLMRVDERRQPSEYVILGLDDPRRSVGKQVDAIPTDGLERARLLVRDAESRYDTTKREVFFVSSRLAAWRRAAARRLGEDLVHADDKNNALPPDASGALFPDLWSKKIASFNAFASKGAA